MNASCPTVPPEQGHWSDGCVQCCLLDAGHAVGAMSTSVLCGLTVLIMLL